MKRRLILILALLSAYGCAVVATPRIVEACSCRWLGPQVRLQMADAVFMGRVLSITSGQSNGAIGSSTLDSVLFEVKSTWKGASSQAFTLTGTGGMCGVD